MSFTHALRTHIQKGSKDPIPEEEFEFQGLEDEDECGTDGEKKDSSTGDKAERGKREIYLHIYSFLKVLGSGFSFAIH